MKRWYGGHTMRGSSEPLLQLYQEGKIEGKRGQRRPRRNWIDDVKEWSGLTSYGDMKWKDENREEWRDMVANLSDRRWHLIIVIIHIIAAVVFLFLISFIASLLVMKIQYNEKDICFITRANLKQILRSSQNHRIMTSLESENPSILSQDRLPFKSRKSFNERKKEVESVRAAHENKFPVIIERYQHDKLLPHLDKSKFLIPDDLNMSDIQKIIR
ncbi:microtubule-associated protein 1 light chain 3 alpha [Elysia marginata]|uniref:Microtubule-associated protein 1 light chain 3 alpha n=1 Tax=Elysia marginata TaxID=1093978 RepID=A0AAV4FMY3_9GAST|nr:microtubule-associated protein 1 light chain 3 alpha [Elysia marginata]